MPELPANGDGQELGGLELLRHEASLRLRPAPGLVVALEGEDDDQPEQDREAGGDHAEHPGRPVAVGEVAAFRSAAADEQHRGHRDARGADGDQDRPGGVYRSAPASTASPSVAAASSATRSSSSRSAMG